MDFSETDEAKQKIHIASLEIHARCSATTVGAAARVNNCDRLACDQATVASFGIETESLSRLSEYVNVVLQLVGNSKVPHWQTEQVLVSRFELVANIHNRLPSRALFIVKALPMKHLVLRVDSISIELGQLLFPQIEGDNFVARMRGLVPFNKGLGDQNGLRTLFAWGGFNVKQLGHNYLFPKMRQIKLAEVKNTSRGSKSSRSIRIDDHRIHCKRIRFLTSNELSVYRSISLNRGDAHEKASYSMFSDSLGSNDLTMFDEELQVAYLAF